MPASRILLALAASSAVALSAPAGGARALEPSAAEDLQRAIRATGPKTSDAPALRLERAPSLAFRLGAALAAWRNASQQLDYDLKTPSGDGDDSETILGDCYDEGSAFNHLEAALRGLGLEPAAALTAAGSPDAALETRWTARRRAPPDACRPRGGAS